MCKIIHNTGQWNIHECYFAEMYKGWIRIDRKYLAQHSDDNKIKSGQYIKIVKKGMKDHKDKMLICQIRDFVPSMEKTLKERYNDNDKYNIDSDSIRISQHYRKILGLEPRPQNPVSLQIEEVGCIKHLFSLWHHPDDPYKMSFRIALILGMTSILIGIVGIIFSFYAYVLYYICILLAMVLALCKYIFSG